MLHVVILARREPEPPILVLTDDYLATPVLPADPGQDVRPCRLVDRW